MSGMVQRGSPVILIELLRFASALAVMGCHYAVGFWQAPGQRVQAMLSGIHYVPPAQGVFNYGWLGVEVFFVISGMVILRSAADVRPTTFLRHRVLRLAPAAWICGGVTVLVLGSTHGFSFGLIASWMRSALFWPMGQQVDGSYWTLGIECVFYLFIAAWIRSDVRHWRLEAAAWVLTLASAAFWISCTLTGPDAALLYTKREVQLLLLPYGCFFAFGMVLAQSQAHGWSPLRLVFAALSAATCALEITVHSMESANETGLATSALLALGAFAGASALLASSNHLQPALSRWINPSTARALGVATYPLYLVHQDAGAALVGWMAGRKIPTGLAILISAGAAIGVAWIVAALIEPVVRAQFDCRITRLTSPHALRRGNRPIAFPPAG